MPPFAARNAIMSAKRLPCVPIRFANEQGVSEGAMYDRVTRQLFRNRGTGAFVIGPDKPASVRGGVSANA